MKSHIAITESLAASYTKAVLHNPKDVVWKNVERAVLDNPKIVVAVNAHDVLVKAAQKALDFIHSLPYEKSSAFSTQAQDNLVDALKLAGECAHEYFSDPEGIRCKICGEFA